MLQPTNTWQWQYVQVEDQLRLDIDSTMAFTTAYRKKHLTQEVFRNTDFSIEDAHYYQFIGAQLQQLGLWNNAHLVQIALNATAVQRFFKPTMPKSWFFKTNKMSAFAHTHQQSGFGVGQICSLYSKNDVGQFLLVEGGDSASLCMLLDESLALSDDQSMGQFEVIKVMNDRLFEPVEAALLKYA